MTLLRDPRDLTSDEALAEVRALLDGLADAGEAERVARENAELFARLEDLGGHLQIKTQNDGIQRFHRSTWRAEQIMFERDRTGLDVVLKSRQIGISTIELARDVQYARTHAGVQVVIVGHESKPTEALFKAVHLMIEGLANAGRCPAPVTKNAREIEFPDNHSIIRVLEAGVSESAAEGKGRSGTIHRLHATEVAFWKQPELTMTALRGAVPKNGEVVIESTPNGASGLFYELVTDALAGRGPYRFHFWPWFAHEAYRAKVGRDFDPTPRDEDERKLRELKCDDEQIQWWRDALADKLKGGREKVLQEYPRDPHSCFRSSEGQYIEAAAIDRLFERVRAALRLEPIIVRRVIDDRIVDRYFGDLAIFAEPALGALYIAAADSSEGIGNDAHAICVTERRSGETVATWANDSCEAGDAGLALAFVCRIFNDALAAPERNKDGAALIRAMTNEKTKVTPYHNIYVHDDGREGWPTTPQTRPPLFDDLRMGIESGELWTPCAATAAEAKTIARVDGKPMARGKGSKGGARDDRFVTWGIAGQVRARIGSGALVNGTPKHDDRSGGERQRSGGAWGSSGGRKGGAWG